MRLHRDSLRSCTIHTRARARTHTYTPLKGRNVLNPVLHSKTRGPRKQAACEPWDAHPTLAHKSTTPWAPHTYPLRAVIHQQIGHTKDIALDAGCPIQCPTSLCGTPTPLFVWCLPLSKVQSACVVVWRRSRAAPDIYDSALWNWPILGSMVTTSDFKPPQSGGRCPRFARCCAPIGCIFLTHDTKQCLKC